MSASIYDWLWFSSRIRLLRSYMFLSRSSMLLSRNDTSFLRSWIWALRIIYAFSLVFKALAYSRFRFSTSESLVKIIDSSSFLRLSYDCVKLVFFSWIRVRSRLSYFSSSEDSVFADSRLFSSFVHFSWQIFNFSVNPRSVLIKRDISWPSCETWFSKVVDCESIPYTFRLNFERHSALNWSTLSLAFCNTSICFVLKNSMYNGRAYLIKVSNLTSL